MRLRPLNSGDTSDDDSGAGIKLTNCLYFADEIFSYLADKQIEEIVMKNGAVGVHILRQQEQCIVPVERVEQVVDTTAAGDAFNGGYMAARLAGRKPVESASYGAKVAATVITYPGAIISSDAFTNHIPSL